MKTILVDAINTFVIKGEGIFKEMQALLDLFDNPKIILTNANDEQMKAFGLDAMPYQVFPGSRFTLRYSNYTCCTWYALYVQEKP